MKIKILLAICIFYLSACSEPEGFTEGAFLRFNNASAEELKVVFSNSDGLTNSLVCMPNVLYQIPIDMHSSSMNFRITQEDKSSIFSISYTIDVRKTAIGFKLDLENISASYSASTSDFDFYKGETLDQENAFKRNDFPLDENSSWYFINQLSGVLWVE